jgi:hypothetical protein
MLISQLTPCRWSEYLFLFFAPFGHDHGSQACIGSVSLFTDDI